jgi:hypothetical protein
MRKAGSNHTSSCPAHPNTDEPVLRPTIQQQPHQVTPQFPFAIPVRIPIFPATFASTSRQVNTSSSIHSSQSAALAQRVPHESLANLVCSPFACSRAPG